MIERLLACGAALACILSLPSLAQETQSSGEEAAEDDSPARGKEAVPDAENRIVIEARRERRRDVLREQARAITRPPRIDRPLGTFKMPVCPQVYGMKREYAAVIEARFRDNLDRLGIRAGSEDCRANVYILFVRDLDEGIREVAKSTPIFKALLSYQRDRVLNETGPVRAWNLSELRDEDGRPFAVDSGSGLPINRPHIATRLRLPVTVEIVGSAVAFDVSGLPGKSLFQLADYATVRGLTAIDPDRRDDPRPLDSILALFDEDSVPPEEMTLFDRAYLKTLYGFPGALRPAQMYDRIAMIAERLEYEDEAEAVAK